jgi:tRNA pseudouridine13 synthase
MEGGRTASPKRMKLYNHFKRYLADFIVQEKISTIEGGDYPLYILKKSNVSTMEAVRLIGRFLKIHPADIGFAGLKDKFGITSQYITLIKGSFPEKVCFVQKQGRWKKVDFVNFYEETGFCIQKVGTRVKKIELGELEGNYFTVTLRNISKEDRKRIYKNIDLVLKYGFANYFGEQRFGNLKGQKHFILPYLLKGDFRKSIEIYLRNKGYKGRLDNWEEVYRRMKGKLEIYERDFILGLKRGLKPEKAFRILPKNIRLMFNFAFQSFLWNKYLYRYIKEKYPYKTVDFINNWKIAFYLRVYDLEYLKELEIPYTGKEYSVCDDLLRKIIKQTLREQGIKEEDINREIIGIKVLTDGKRKAVVFPENLKVQGKNNKVLTIQFFLPSGSYATVLLRNLLS